MKPGTKKYNREIKTIHAMLDLYCRGHHRTSVTCDQCEELLAYIKQQLEKCPYGEDKPTCAKCPVHCYNPAMRGRVISVMRYAGPRLVSRHPLLTLLHLLRGLRKPTPRIPKTRKGI